MQMLQKKRYILIELISGEAIKMIRREFNFLAMIAFFLERMKIESVCCNGSTESK